jgi:hypothetical protein
MPKFVRAAVAVLLFMAAGAVVAAGPSRGQRNKLDESQRIYSAALRWSDFEGAYTLLDPEYRKLNPLTDLKLERYKQIQVTGYRDVGSSALEDGSMIRDIDMSVINRHTQAERSLRYREQWRWDKEAKRWWVVSGLPDLWDGQ